jgi:predicted transcriptional regulator
MRRSKLEINIDILKILAQKGPLKLTHIMYKANLNCDVLKKNVAFLMEQGLINNRIVGRGKSVYSISNQGLTLLKGWRDIRDLLPAFENERQPLFRNSISVQVRSEQPIRSELFESKRA